MSSNENKEYEELGLFILGEKFYVADPGFPGVWAATPKVGVKSYYLVNFFPKTA